MSNVPTSFTPIIQESLQFNNPVSEASMSAMGGAINGLLSIVLPVGSIIDSMLTESQFQSLASVNWILADGRNVSGSTYSSITSETNAPDLRSVITRGKDNGRGLNPNGDQTLGTYTADVFASHNHVLNDPGHNHSFTGYRTSGAGGVGQAFPSSPDPFSVNPAFTGITLNASGGSETAPKTVTVNKFIRIN